MKLKNVVVVCGLALTTTLAGCGMSTSNESGVDVQETTIGAISQDDSQENTQETTTKEVSQENTQEDTQETTTKDVSQETVQAQSEAGESKDELKVKALLAYQEILKAAPAIEGEHEELEDAAFDYDQNLQMFGNHYDAFAILDINQDGIPELIALSTVNFRWTPVSVYTYADGNAVLLKDPADGGAHGTFEQSSTANGTYTTYICGENHIHSVWRGTNPMGDAEEENHAYVVEGTTLTATDCSVGENGNTIYFSDIAKENVAENVDAITK